MSNSHDIETIFGNNNFRLDNNGSAEMPKEEVLTALKSEIATPRELYEKSGLKNLLTPLLKPELKGSIVAGFVEVSTYASTLHNNSLDAFNLSFVNLLKNQGISRNFHSNVSKYFPSVIAKLREKDLILFNYPDFSNEPQERYPIMTIIDGDKHIYDQDVLHVVDRKYQELVGSIREHESNNTTFTKDENLPEFKLAIRKSNLQDEHTTYRGIKEVKPDLVKKAVEQEFGILKTTSKKVLALHYLNHRLYHTKFQEKLNNNNPSILISLPLLAPHPSKGGRYLGLGAVFVYLILEKDFDAVTFKQHIEIYCANIWSIIRNYLIGYIFQIGSEKLLQFEKEATKSAIAAVMSRNMSHNIGSHVLVKLSVPENVGDPQRIVVFNQYLKHRMSFIADLSTSQTSNSGSNFLNNDILKKFRNLYMLKNHISGNDLLNANSINLNYWCDIEGLSKDTDLALQIPGDTIGNHAIYIFIENFIRNAVKYSRIPEKTKNKKGTKGARQMMYTLDVNICLSQPDNELKDLYYIIDIFDNCSEVNFNTRKQTDCKDNDKVEETRFCLLKKLQNDIDRSVLKNGAPRIGGWGILEMKICAAFLRKYDLKDIDIPPSKKITGQPDILKVHYYSKQPDGKVKIVSPAETNYSSGDLNLGYRFFLLKPKRIALPNNERWLLAVTPEINKKLEFHGIYFIDINPGIAEGIEHEILVIDNSFKYLEPAIRSGTQRLLVLNTEQQVQEIQAALQAADIELVEALVWRFYCAAMNYSGNIDIYKVNQSVSFTGKNVNELIILDDHGFHFDQVCQLKSDNKSIVASPVLYYEPYGSQSGTGSFVERIDLLKKGNYGTWQSRLQEVANIHIAVLDERIQRAACVEAPGLRKTHEAGGEKVLLGEVLEKMKIHIPGKDIDLDKQFFDQGGDKDLLIVERWVEELIKKYSIKFLLIHLSLIEKLKDSSPDAVATFYEKWTKRWGHQFTLIIISGRGEPSTIPNGSYFIPYDCIEEYLLRNRSKFNLINLIYCTNKRNVNEK